MVFKGAAAMIIRLSRTIICHPLKPTLKPQIHDLSQLNKNSPVYSKHPTRFYLFPSVYRSFFPSYGLPNGHYHSSLSNLMPFRIALDEIKRRLFFAGSYFHSLFVFFLFILSYAYHYSQFL